MVHGYSALAKSYIDLFGNVGAVHPDDLDMIDECLGRSAGTLLDAGCGPGHLAGHLGAAGAAVIAVDLTLEFVRHGRDQHRSASFGAASITALPFREGAFGGVLAWYSLIHLSATGLDGVLGELRRVAAPDAPLVVGFFHGRDGEPFEHRVAPARYWSLDGMSERLRRAGFAEIRRGTRPGDTESAVRPHAAIVAVAG